jgi:hypothetical protein
MGMAHVVSIRALAHAEKQDSALTLSFNQKERTSFADVSAVSLSAERSTGSR